MESLCLERSDDVTAISINDVRHVVIRSLEEAFPNIQVSGEKIEPLLDPPRFFVQLLEPSHTQELGRRYRRNHPFVIRYVSPNGTNDEMYAMAEQLTTVLRQITVGGGAVVGTGMKFEIVDQVLHFHVNYTFLVWDEKPNDSMMGTLDQEGYVRG